VLSAGTVTLLVCFLPTIIYTLLIQGLRIEIGDYRTEVPSGLTEAGIWAVTACLIHTTAAMISTLLTVKEIKRRHANGLELMVEDPVTRCAVIGLQAAILPGVIIVAFSLLNQRSLRDIILIVLPFVTGYFISSYTRSFFDLSKPRFISPFAQGYVMASTGLMITLVLVPTGPVQNWPIVVWIFMSYVTVTAGCIGWTLGAMFKHCLANNVHRLALSDERISPSGLSFARQSEPAIGN
jgi:hypothetical protein